MHQVYLDIETKVSAWQKDPTIGVASDLLSFSYIPKTNALLEEPSKFLIERGNQIPAPLLSLAKRNVEYSNSHERLPSVGYCQLEIGRLKKQLILNPRDSLSLVDIARLYAAQGQNAHARRAILTAVALSPRHRFVVRSASRFLVHDGDLDRAFDVLNRSHLTTKDPWILSAVISVETIRGKTPQNMRLARRMVEAGDFASSELTELAAAMSTVMEEAGELKNAKRLLNTALKEPNDNVVAQAVWAASEFQMPLNFSTDWPADAEAAYYRSEDSGDFEGALASAWSWFEDEPFSTRPLRGAAFAASIAKHYETAESVMRQALKLGADNSECKNNLAFSLLAQGRFIEAHEILEEIIRAESGSGLSGHTLANLGMLAYRNADIERGRELYKQACEKLSEQTSLGSFALCCAYWAREAKLAADPSSEQIATQAKAVIDRSTSSAARVVFQDSQKEEDRSPVTESVQHIRNSVTASHDREKNILILDRVEGFKVRK